MRLEHFPLESLRQEEAPESYSNGAWFVVPRITRRLICDSRMNALVSKVPRKNKVRYLPNRPSSITLPGTCALSTDLVDPPRLLSSFSYLKKARFMKHTRICAGVLSSALSSHQVVKITKNAPRWDYFRNMKEPRPAAAYAHASWERHKVTSRLYTAGI